MCLTSWYNLSKLFFKEVVSVKEDIRDPGMVKISIAVGQLFFIWRSCDAAEPVFGDAAATAHISGISGDVLGVPGDASGSMSSDSVSVCGGVS